MKILALEFSSTQRSVAVQDLERPDKGTVTVRAESDPRGLNGLRLISDALEKSAAGRAEVATIVVGLGPGSYTGIRAAISIAQGWKLATGIEVLGISSMDALAAQAAQEGVEGTVRFAIDAQRGQFALTRYRLDQGVVERLDEMHLAEAEVIEAMLARGETVAGPGLDQKFATARSMFPRAADLIVLGLRTPHRQPAEDLEPIYLRGVSFVKAKPPIST